ncbi:MAG: hypothetical protein HND57_11515 [Planctomycetes bacterium]|nr:hypothetical protein [Planctomycetota bacterium]
MLSPRTWWLLGIIILTLALPAPSVAVAQESDSQERPNLSPADWSPGDLQQYMKWQLNPATDRPLVKGTSGVIAASSSPIAARAGLEALKQGGTAADAVLTTALAQITMSMGASISYAGVFELVYYDAESDHVYALDAGFQTVSSETDPLTIPTLSYMNSDRQPPDPKQIGRTVLVPGFMAGVEATHRRFGKLPVSQVFAPAIYFAENGFEVSDRLGKMIAYRPQFLVRREETKAVFTNPRTGDFYKAGDTVRQPELAHTLRQVAELGAPYMYTGAWAEKLVATVQADGGLLSMQDMASYRVQWAEPSQATYRSTEICSNPNAYGVAGALKLIEEGHIAGMGHYTESPLAFFWVHNILRAVRTHPQYGCLMLNTQPAKWLDDGTAQQVWQELADQYTVPTPSPPLPMSDHTSSVVAADQYGNVAALVHSINTSLWGESGIVIDGVSIPDAAGFQQQLIQSAGPGRKLPNVTQPLIALRDGHPILAVGAIGTAIDYDTTRAVLNMLAFDMDPKAAITAPSLLASLDDHERALAGDYSDDFVSQVGALGMQVEVVDARTASRFRGAVVALAIDQATHTISGSAASATRGASCAY